MFYFNWITFSSFPPADITKGNYLNNKQENAALCREPLHVWIFCSFPPRKNRAKTLLSVPSALKRNNRQANHAYDFLYVRERGLLVDEDDRRGTIGNKIQLVCSQPIETHASFLVDGMQMSLLMIILYAGVFYRCVVQSTDQRFDLIEVLRTLILLLSGFVLMCWSMAGKDEKDRTGNDEILKSKGKVNVCKRYAIMLPCVAFFFCFINYSAMGEQ